MGKSNTEMLAIAKKYLGKGGATFRKYCGLPSGTAWCNAYVCYIFNEAGNSSLYYGGKKVTYCPTSIKWCQSNLAQIPIYLALPMDVIYFDWEPNGIPNHIGFVRERKSDQDVYTIEGNTSGGIVANKTRTEKYVCGCFRPHYKPTSFSASKKLTVDGYFGYNSIAVMQKWLGVTQDAILGQGTVKALQKKLGVTQDGSWGKATSKALQKLIGTTVDGAFGAKSVKALQTYLNKQVFGSVTVSTPSTEVKAELPTLTLKKTSAEVIADALTFAKWIVGDDRFGYGRKGGAKYKGTKEYSITHSGGCHFCGSNATKISKAKKAGLSNPEEWEYTFVCNTLVHACYAHAGIPSMLSAKGHAWWTKSYKGSKYWTEIKKPTKITDLKAGDVLASDSHFALYIGNGQIAEATSQGDASSSKTLWAKSIHTCSGASFFKKVTNVFRLTSGVNTTAVIRYGEVSARVKLWQKFLNSYNGKTVVAEDGIFGDTTLKYTKAFQTAQKIAVDGIVGSGTLASAQKVR